MSGRILAALLLLVAACGLPSAAMAQQKVDYQAVVAEIGAAGDAAVAAYDPEVGDETGDAFSDIYFDIFEDTGMEAAVGMRDPGLKTELESLFGRVIGLSMKGAPKDQVAAAWRALQTRLQETADAQAGEAGGFWAAAVQSFLILLREGFEAMLVVTALVAYLNRTAPDKTRVIWHGVGWALAASVATAVAVSVLFDISGAAQEALEGVTMLIASAVLFYVSYWLISKREADRWSAYVRQQIDKAVASGSLVTLGFAAFLAVYREGAETVLFYQALLGSQAGQGLAIAGGFAVALVVLGIIYWAMRSASLRLPIGLFFTVTAGLLYYLAVAFAGNGILELQEAQLVSITPIDWLPQITWLGLHPTVESVAAQLIVLAPLPVAILWWVHRRRQLALAMAGEAAQ